MAIPMARQNQMLKQLHSPHLPENRTDASSIVLWPPPTTGQHLIGCYLLNTDWCPFLFLVCVPFLFFVWFFRSLVLPRVQQGCPLHRCVWEDRLVWERNWKVKISGITLNCQPQNCLLVDNPEVGNFEYIHYSELPSPLMIVYLV